MTDVALSKVKKAATARSIADWRLELAMREAHTSGQALRKIAEAAGMSHEQVRRMISRDQASGS